MKNIGIFEINVTPYIHVTYIVRIYVYLKNDYKGADKSHKFYYSRRRWSRV